MIGGMGDKMNERIRTLIVVRGVDEVISENTMRH